MMRIPTSLRTALLCTAIAVLLGWFGPVVLDGVPTLDDHHGEYAQAQDLRAAIDSAARRTRFERAAQAMCAAQAAWAELADGAVQCRTKHGRPTSRAAVQVAAP